jgi:hypothetical protein
LLFRWFWQPAWASLLVRSRPKTLLLTPLKAQKLLLKVLKLLLKALWKPLKALLKQPAKPLLLLVTLLLLAPWKLRKLLVKPLPLLAKLLKARWKQPSKFFNLPGFRGRHSSEWRPFPFGQSLSRVR